MENLSDLITLLFLQHKQTAQVNSTGAALKTYFLVRFLLQTDKSNFLQVRFTQSLIVVQ